MPKQSVEVTTNRKQNEGPTNGVHKEGQTTSILYGRHQQYCNTSKNLYLFLKVVKPQDPFKHVYLIRRSQN